MAVFSGISLTWMPRMDGWMGGWGTKKRAIHKMLAVAAKTHPSSSAPVAPKNQPKRS
jgi:hypothetical protein